ncbi:uncharacterized protein LOC135846229 [Planococcus citri]|uniref:uncharacterized protein LOC135846229 n=1 Tax=Planococcus citri TaxID=170843 RepID=UPI0031F72DE5
MELNRLPGELQSQLRSDLVARNVSNCIIELVENALDANASCVAVRIDFDTFRLEVVDNGTGLTKADLKLVGERYFTSKRKDSGEINPTSKHFGYRGEGLASIKNVSSRVMIISRAFDDDATYCKVIEKSNAEVLPSQHDRKSVGTTVIVENFLDKLPVRQKYIKPSEEFQTIKWYLQATALMFPKVNFSLRNDSKKSEIFRIDRTNSTASTFLELFRGAVKDPSSFLKLKSAHIDISAKIMLSQEPCSTDQLQFVFINKRYLPKSDMQKYLNTLLDRIDPSKKKISRKTIYILNVSAPRDDYEVTYESDGRFVEFKNWTKVKQCLLNLAKSIAGEERSCNLEENVEKPSKEIVPVKDAFREMNTAHTIFGLPANRKKLEKPVKVYDIDDESNSSGERKKKQAISRLFKVSKASRKITKNTKATKSPRLVDQGITLSFKKSPMATRRPAEEKNTRKCTKNRDISVDKAAPSNDDYAWMWKHPDKGHDSDSTNFSDTQQVAAKESRVVCSKLKKNKKLPTEKKQRGECFKSVVALSNRRALKLPTRDRISKKRNNYFDQIENKNNVIEKYGKINKNAQYVLDDDLNVDEPDEIGNDVQWTAKISVDQNTTTLPPLKLFDKQPSPELDFQEDEIQYKENVDHSNSGRFADQHDALVATLPFHESYLDDRSPLQDVRQSSYHHSHRLSYDLTQENLKRDCVTSVEIQDPLSKVGEWISKLPPNEEPILNDSANDYLTPVKNSDQIAIDFKRKTKLSKTPDNDTKSTERTPEKRKSTLENFEPKCKLKLDFSRAKIEEYRMKKKSCPEPAYKSPLLDWNNHPVRKLRQNDKNHLKGEFDRARNESISFQKTHDSSKEHMSWNNLNDSIDQAPSRKETRAVSTQTSDCCGKCRCNCHEKLATTLNISQQSIFHDDDDFDGKDAVILTKSQLLDSPAADSEHDTVILPKEDHDTFDLDRRNAMDFSQFDEDAKEQNSADTIVLSQHFAENSASTKNSEYFQSKMMVEKLRFKMKSKFLENSSALDIPKGMLESVPKNQSRVERLHEDEKKSLVELVKPYRMQNHITLDDSGNSCLRIFPMFKNQPKKLDSCNSEDLNCPVVLTKEDIPSFKFIAQIEKKFILASAIDHKTQAPLLIVLDQHAVDERIRVERLLRDYSENGEWQSTPVNPHIHLNISFTYCSLFTDYQSNLEEFGLHYEFNNRTMNNEAKLIVSFTKVPTCFYNRAMREKNNYRDVLKKLIESLTKELLTKFIKGETLVHTVPNELQSVVNYEACRGAVKFGDKLTPQICSALLEGMSQCKLPFQCAHGRPSAVPLVSFDKLAHLQRKVWKPNYEELRKKFVK